MFYFSVNSFTVYIFVKKEVVFDALKTLNFVKYYL